MLAGGALAPACIFGLVYTFFSRRPKHPERATMDHVVPFRAGTLLPRFLHWFFSSWCTVFPCGRRLPGFRS